MASKYDKHVPFWRQPSSAPLTLPFARLDSIVWPPPRPPVLRKTAGVPPRGFEPLISTLKGWRPRPLDDEGEAPPSVAKRAPRSAHGVP